MLRESREQCLVFRVTGLSGLGKTRLVYESLSPDDLKNHVIYVKASAFQNSTLYTAIQNDGEMSAIVVIDECDLQQHDEFVRSFSVRGHRLALITLSYEIGKVSPPSVPHQVSALGSGELEAILSAEFPALPQEVIRRLAVFADGYPRIGILLAQSYLSGAPEPNEFISIDDDGLMNRLIAGHLDQSSVRFANTKRVLMGLSLFEKVGYEAPVTKEAEWVAKEVDVDWNEFREIVAEQRHRGTLQGQHYLYVTPFMLRVHLLKEWWDVRGMSQENLNDFVSSMPEESRLDLFRRFLEHIPYVSSTERGQKFTELILSPEGLFADGSLIRTDLGGRLFLALTEANPESALECLSRTVGTWSREELQQFADGRMHIVWSLERIAIWRHLFRGAATLLLALAEAENQTWSNNASGVFAGLFSPGYGPLASTEAPPYERLPVLVEALKEDSVERRVLGLRACNAALEARSIIRMVGAEHQGLRREPKMWMPATLGGPTPLALRPVHATTPGTWTPAGRSYPTTP
jgi:hypothetical protein